MIMKKIGILYLGRRGAAPVDTLEITSELIKENTVYLFLSKRIENLDKFFDLQKSNSNLKINVMDTYSSKIGFMFKSLNLFRFLNSAHRIQKIQLDYLYIPMITYWAALIVAFLKEQKIVTAIHDPIMHTGEKDFLFEKLTYLTVKKSSKLVVFSEKFKKTVSELYNFPYEKICSLKLGGYSYYESKAKNNIIENENNRILFFGRISKYKGLEILLEAFKKVLIFKPDLKLKIVGNGSFSDREEKLIYELQNHLEVVNRWIKDDEVESFFLDVDFIVLPYLEATQSGVIMLSYAMGKAVVCTNVGALDEQILDTTGVLVSPNNSEDLCKGILDMYNNREYIQKGKNAFYFATKEWTWQNQVKKLMQFLQEN